MPSLMTGKGVNLESRNSYSRAKLAQFQDSSLSSAFSLCLWEIDSRTSADTKILGCLSPVVGSGYLWREDLWRWRGDYNLHTKRTLFPVADLSHLWKFCVLSGEFGKNGKELKSQCQTTFPLLIFFWL